jgi:hypothetical protein
VYCCTCCTVCVLLYLLYCVCTAVLVVLCVYCCTCCTVCVLLYVLYCVCTAVLVVLCVYCCTCCTVCVLLYLSYCVCTAGATLDAELLARSQYPESPATGQLDTGFSSFPCVYKQMLRCLPTFQFATTCFSCSPPDLQLNVSVASFIYIYYM